MNTVLTAVDWAALSPLLIVLIGALLVVLLEAFASDSAEWLSSWLTAGTIIIAIYASYYAPVSTHPRLTSWLIFDTQSHIFSVLFLSIGLCTVFLSASFFQRFAASQGEYYFLLLSAIFGLILIGSSADFLTLFLGLETLSISLYVSVGYMKKWNISHEAAVKYFLIGSIAAAILLYGIALIYGALGTTRLSELLTGFRDLTNNSDRFLFLGGVALVTIGIAFKAAIVPFHVWAPDVYEGAPTPVTAFMSVGTKAGAFAAFARVFLDALPGFDSVWSDVVAFLVYPTLIYSAFLAMRQVQLRRFFAYSGISHAGFLLIPIAVGGPEALTSLIFYLIVYSAATFGCFATLAYLDFRTEGVLLKDLHGLFKRAPFIASVFTLSLLTLAGIPPTAGFFAKFYVFKVAFAEGFYALVIIALLTTILSAYYYLRIIAAMLTDVSSEESVQKHSLPATVVAVVAVCAIVFFSLFPAPLLTVLYAN
ncbi:MAG: NADH-quinone oxidoreductase subunit N [Chlamydiales bacterium]|nr:NADH-quinone oxidoreductase subunit N [Chlamydiales bacterium]